jgi:hypothetical protein
MLFHSWLQKLRSGLARRGSGKNRRQSGPQSASRQLNLEILEERTLPSFVAPISYAAGSQPVAMATADFSGDTRVVGDFNGDGALDLVAAIAQTSFGQVSVSLGNGDGTFQATRLVAAGGSNVVALAAADFNGDGKLDLAVGGHNNAYFGSQNDFSMLLGRGDGTFVVSYDYPSNGDEGGWATGMAAGDFNGDGKVDLAVAGDGVDVSLGNGDGTFRGGSYIAVPYAGAVTVADLNGDGKLDLAVTSGLGSYGGSVSVSLGNGDGSFQSAMNYASGSQPLGLVAADFNGDGKLDLVTTGWKYSNGNYNSPPVGVTSVFLGNGDGTLRAAQYFTAGSDTESVAVGDFNSDSRPDVAVTDYSTGNVLVLLNTGDWHSLQFTGFPSTATAGQAQTLTVTVLDNNFNPLPSYTGTVHFSSSDPQAVLPADYTFTAADRGTHTFTVTLKTAGIQAINVGDTKAGFTTAASGITVKAAAASQFVISAPAKANSGVVFALTVTVKDRYGNVVTDYAGTIYLSSTDSSATLPAFYTFTAADWGQHVFSGVVLRKTGKQTITITDHSLGLSSSVMVDVGGKKK